MKPLLLILTFVVLGCAPSTINQNRTEPTPFVVGKQKVIVPGCDQLHEDVKKWNEENPNKEPRIADC